MSIIRLRQLHYVLLTNSARYNTTQSVTRWDSVNRYGYLATSLFIPYSLANLLTCIAVVLGLISYQRHGVYPDKKFQDIASAAQDPQVSGHMQEGRRHSVVASHTGEKGLVLRLIKQDR